MTHQLTQVTAHKVKPMWIRVQNRAHSQTQTTTESCRATFDFFFHSLSVQMKCLSSQILCEKHIQVIKSNPLWIRLLFESNRQLWDVACLCTWPGSSSNVPSSSSSWGLMICTSTLRGQLPRAFNPQRYDTMLDVVSSIRISLLFLFSSLFPSFPL